MDKAQLNRAYFEARDWLRTYYKGVQMLKYPSDLFVYEKILQETDPDLIIETGTLDGASALWLKDHSNAHIVTIDVDDRAKHKQGITYIVESSLTAIEQVKQIANKYRKIMVILDSNHYYDHVKQELELYAPLVSKGCYLVTEDTFISQYLNNEDYPGGSVWEAVQEWDKTGFELQQDTFQVSMNPNGWYKRV